MKEKLRNYDIQTRLILFAFSMFLFICKVNASENEIKLYTAHIDSGYLALRSECAFDEKNEKYELYEGYVVAVMDIAERDNSDYCYVYSYDARDFGYVNRNYLKYKSVLGNDHYQVKVEKGYLAVRNAQAYDEKNEIGELYSGDHVIALEDYSEFETYLPVYCFEKELGGFVNKNYLSLSTDKNFQKDNTLKQPDTKQNQAGTTNNNTTIFSDSTYGAGNSSTTKEKDNSCTKCHGSGNCQVCGGQGSNECSGWSCHRGRCGVCNGNGYTWSMDGKKKINCSYCSYGNCRVCNGTGRRDCSICRGTGKCTKCGGLGK